MNTNEYGLLPEENPRAYFALKAIEGNDRALGWLKKHHQGLYLFARAWTGDLRAFKALRSTPSLDLEDLFEAIADDELAPYLRKRLPDLHLLFAAVKGDPQAARQLERKRRKPPLSEIAQVLETMYENRVDEDERPGPEAISENAAADMSCLIGDLHMKNGELEKAVDAFSRAIDNRPTVDAYEGRARAYRALADEDERTARELRKRL
jgi:tetratricopeptide (TPR) repeat protein